MFVAGIDVGSVAAKAVVLEKLPDKEARPAGRAILPTGWNAAEAGRQALELACAAAVVPREALCGIVATGYGRISLPFADKSVTEISCHARGAAHIFPKAGIILDIGGQDSKVISVETQQGQACRRGTVRDFIMNDKCAAGTGRFLQVLSGILNMPLDELSKAAASGHAVSISSMCAVFAETEIVGLLAGGTPPQDVAAGVFRSIARRMCGLARRIAMHDEFVFTGGLASSQAFTAILSAELGLPVNVPRDPQAVGALGAALLALDFGERNGAGPEAKGR